MVSEYKTCPLCKRTLLREKWFYWRKNGAHGMRWESRCKTCCRKLNGAASPYYEKNKARHRDWYARNRDEQLEKTRKRQPEIYKRRLSSGLLTEYSRRERHLLTDNYVKSLLAHRLSEITRGQITQELIALKREHIAVKRAKKLVYNALKERHESSKDTD